MGWSGGSAVMNKIIDVLDGLKIKEDLKKDIFKAIIRALQWEDWDTEMDCVGRDEIFDKALRELEPEWFENLEEI